MNQFSDSKILPFSSLLLFDTVINVEEYPEFLPWCENVKILSRSTNDMLAEMTISFKGLKNSYTSTIKFQIPNENTSGKIEIASETGAFSHLHSVWEFIQLKNSTLVKFEIKYAFKFKFIDYVISKLYKRAQEKIITAFINRIYEKNPALSSNR